MQYRSMGKRIPWKVSALGFGAMRLPWKKFLFLKRPDFPRSIEIIRYAIDNGINYIDTAYTYMGGKSENIVGEALRNGYREKVHVVTKLPIWKVKSRDDFDKFLNEQLERLKTDYLDIYLFHGLNKDRFCKIKELDLISKMEKARDQGKINHIGFSFHDNFNVFKEIVDYYDWDMCLIQMNLMDTENQATLRGIEYASSKGLGVAIMEPLRGGKLANPPEEVKKIIESAPVRRTPVDWALQFLWNLPGVSVVLSGMGSIRMVKENIKSASESGIGKLTPEELEVIGKMVEFYKSFKIIPCTGCNYCLEICPNMINIPRVFEIINRYSEDGNVKRAKRELKKLKKNKAKISRDNPQGSPLLCTECRKCMEACPQKIEIPDMLRKAVEAINKGIDPKIIF